MRNLAAEAMSRLKLLTRVQAAVEETVELLTASDVLLDADKARANKILRRAINLAKNPMAKEWLRDGKASGTWIRTAADLLERSAAKAAELGLSEADVDDQVASMLAWMALSAILRDAKKGDGLLTAAEG